ncbi:hypothetical protein GCM10008018_08450 [Paenibacillus marchantiophytorum]|uniref:HTH araC/xylS-type domain-containing protein n=2 Tax=Paenibacillus marchantiophytorum TaxID=1619310 RepID=A0ABQ2BPT6_9BACL|nr:hypothetical protein GCM10008018_08450 [Paenibacillus marchantiophytorum]
MNSKRFSYYFYKYTGFRPINFFIQYRMERASELLKIGDFPISYIAVSVGYANPLYFSRASLLFIAERMLATSEYRKTIMHRVFFIGNLDEKGTAGGNRIAVSRSWRQSIIISTWPNWQRRPSSIFFSEQIIFILARRWWPRTITDATNRKVVLKERPKRVAVLHPLYLDYFFGKAEIADLGAGKDLNMEAIIEAMPDVIAPALLAKRIRRSS